MTTEAAELIFASELSPRLLALVLRERALIQEVSQRAMQMIRSSVPDYGLSSEPRILDDLRDSSQLNAELWFAALLDRRPVTEAVLEPLVALAQRRVHQGISLTGLLRAYRIIAHAFWLRLIEGAGGDLGLMAELTEKISPFLLQHFDLLAEHVATHYLLEQSQYARWRDRLRQELWSIVRSRPDDVDGFRRHADLLGLVPDRPYCAIALHLSDTAAGDPERHVDPLLLTVARRLSIPPDALMRAIDRDAFVVWVPQPDEQPAVSFERGLAAATAAILNSSPIVVGAGVGLPGTGSRGWLASMEQAYRARNDALAKPAGGDVHRYSRILVDDAIRTIPNAAEFMRSAIATLAVDPLLVETLRAYLANGLQRKVTAAALGVHPNTLDHRLARIETLLDGRFSDLSWIERIGIALRIGQPRRPL